MSMVETPSAHDNVGHLVDTTKPGTPRPLVITAYV